MTNIMIQKKASLTSINLTNKTRNTSKDHDSDHAKYTKTNTPRLGVAGGADPEMCEVGDSKTQKPMVTEGSPYKEKKVQVSQSTARMNDHVESQLCQLTKVQKFMLDSQQPYLKYEKVNCSEVIEKVHQHYKAMAYSLKRIVCSEDESHIQISTGLNAPIDVVADTLMFFKIKV